MRRFFFDMQRVSMILLSVIFLVSVCSAAELNPGDIVVLNAQTGCAGPPMVLKVNPTTGSQTIISQGGMMTSPHTVFLDSRGDLIVSDRNFQLIRIKVVDGSQSLINVFSSYIRGIAEEADGSLLLIERPNKLLRVDPDSGEAEVVTSGNLLTNPFDLVINANGDVYLTNLFSSPTIVRINPVTGNQEQIFSSQFQSLYGIAFDIDENLLVAENRTSGNSVDDDAVLWVNKSTGASTVLWQQGWAAIDVDVFFDGSLLIVDQGPGSGCDGIECMLLRFDRTTNTTEPITTGGYMSVCQSALIVPGPPPIPDISVSPLIYDFGDVELGSTSTVLINISNEGDADLTVDDISLQSGLCEDFTVTPVTLPLVIPPEDTEDVEITYTPSEVGSCLGVLEIASDDPDEPVVEVELSGTGIESTSTTIDAILEFFDQSVKDGTIEGRGRRWLAKVRLCLFRKMLETTGWLIEKDKMRPACFTLHRAYLRCDGKRWRLPDFIDGEAVPQLADKIKDLMDELGCELPRRYKIR
jgi:Abnormal spindle-like microcephaly-assoc'd, ASPM-SPD-2-Hydin